MRGAAIALLVVILAIVGIGSNVGIPASRSNAIAALLTETDPPDGFEYALQPRAFTFPRDHAAHPRFRSEWWYFTGNTEARNGRPFGFQLTIFRFALTPDNYQSRSPWRRANLFLGHFAISDIESEEFISFERLRRPALDIAGVRDDHPKIWVQDWSIELLDTNTERWHLQANEDGIGLDLSAIAKREIVAQGTDGLSPKSERRGNASYYYSIPRLAVSGTINTPTGAYQVTGDAWYDHEWSTSALEEGQVGWDWFSLHLDDDRELMFYQIRDASDGASATSHGVLVSATGTHRRLRREDVELTVSRHWRSPVSRRRYPAGWRLRVPSEDLSIDVLPRFAGQEWRKNFVYWEGAVTAIGTSRGKPVTAKGYVELVGYD